VVDVLRTELLHLGQGKVEPAAWLDDPEGGWKTDPFISAHRIGGYHHMGTTRMSDDPRLGVTDSYGRVHDVENLYIVGSSTFPTSGWANPTLTIVAPALRTSDQISAQLNKERVAHAS
jgi:choline dehydrogenase-like flavoprotein